jgi:hypothetical protein
MATIYFICFPFLATFLIYLSYNPAPSIQPTLPQQYLLPAYIHEQESKAQIHLVKIAQIVNEFNMWNQQMKTRREIVLVLPNVGGSRISACSFKPYSYYYGQFPVHGVKILQQSYTPDVGATSQIITLFPDFSKLAVNTTRPMCMDGTDKYHVERDDVPKHRQIPTAFQTRLDLKKVSQEPDILLIDWHLPTADTGVPMIPYHSMWQNLAMDIVGKEKYVGVHWRFDPKLSPQGCN